MAALYEELKKKKSELGITTEQLSRLSGVPVGCVKLLQNRKPQQGCCLPGFFFLFCLVQFWRVFSPIYPPR